MVGSSSFVELNNVSVNYQRPLGLLNLLGKKPEAYSVLRDITFNLPAGMHVTVFGGEGAGKTTLLRLLTGILKPVSGSVRVNGVRPYAVKHIAAGYVSSEETEPEKETAYQILTAFARTHGTVSAAARIREISDVLALGPRLFLPAAALSSAGKMRLNIARAALADSPLVLLDDAADQLGAGHLADIISRLFAGRTVMVATRHAATAQALDLPLLLLHGGRLAHHGTIEEIASHLSCPRHLDVWMEGLRYDLLRRLRGHPGVLEARLIPTSSFSGQRLRVTLRSGRYLPTMYDIVSQAPLIKVEELPASLYDVIDRLS